MKRSRICVAAMLLTLAGCTSSSGGSSPTGATSAGAAGSPSPLEDSPSETTVELRGCIPACVEGITEPGALPEGEYQTEWFFGGEMRLTFDAGWSSREDSSGEFHASPPDNPEENDIDFWEDVYPVKRNTVKRIKGVPPTAAGLLDWMKSSPQLEVSAPTPGAIGAFPATVVDVRVADDAVNDDPNCPVSACVNFLGFPQWDGPFGIIGGQVLRFYLSDVTYGGRDHLFVVVIYSANPAGMKTLGPAGERLIGTVRVPDARPA